MDVARSIVPAKGKTLLLRMRESAHHAFDPIWKYGKMTRPEAYAWLAQQLQIPVEYCHMSQFDIVTCRRVVEICVMADFEKLGPIKGIELA